MANILLQDLTAMIHNTSRFNGNAFDMVHVEILLQTDVQLTSNEQWFVPAGVSVPDEILAIFKATKLAMYPMSAQKVIEGTQDIIQQAESGNLQEVVSDAAKLMLRAIMKKMSFTPVSGSNNLYLLAYDYKLFPLKESPNMFDFKVVLPFDGLGMVNGSRVQMTIILPISARLEPDATQGITVGGQTIQEITKPMENVNRQIVSFEYHQDPEFTVRYMY